MTGGGYPDGIRQIVDAYLAGRREEAVAGYDRWLPLINYENRQMRAARGQGADEGRWRDRVGGGAPSVAAAASPDPRRPDRDGAAPRSAGSALGAVGLG